MRWSRAGLVLMLGILWGCAPKSGNVGTLDHPPLKRGTIELYRDAKGVCRTNTTPFIRVHKNRDSEVEWQIRDRVQCIREHGPVEIKFDKKDNPDLLPECTKRGERRIECALGKAVAGRSEYTVYIGTQGEDPELEIEEM